MKKIHVNRYQRKSIRNKLINVSQHFREYAPTKREIVAMAGFGGLAGLLNFHGKKLSDEDINQLSEKVNIIKPGEIYRSPMVYGLGGGGIRMNLSDIEDKPSGYDLLLTSQARRPLVAHELGHFIAQKESKDVSKLVTTASNSKLINVMVQGGGGIMTGMTLARKGHRRLGRIINLFPNVPIIINEMLASRAGLKILKSENAPLSEKGVLAAQPLAYILPTYLSDKMIRKTKPGKLLAWNWMREDKPIKKVSM